MRLWPDALAWPGLACPVVAPSGHRFAAQITMQKSDTVPRKCRLRRIDRLIQSTVRKLIRS